ncbi:hypothetical protein A6P54_18990 [Bacillus sp. MKU004]|nr:hypothetical protein A6P54_18990 [Bacillus sp. MKU004]
MFLAACQQERSEKMVLLDEKISAVDISESKGLGGMNEQVLMSFTDKDSLSIFKTAITTARKQPGKVDLTEPDYDVMVQYESEEGQLQTHGIHLWLGDEGEASTLVYVGDETVYHAPPEITKQLRGLIVSEG